MKTAVSIPDDVFERAERLAKRARHSRSEVFSRALREYAIIGVRSIILNFE